MYNKFTDTIIKININRLFKPIPAYNEYRTYMKVFELSGDEKLFTFEIDNIAILKIYVKEKDNLVNTVNKWLNKTEINNLFEMFCNIKTNVEAHYDINNNIKTININNQLYFELPFNIKIKKLVEHLPIYVINKKNNTIIRKIQNLFYELSRNSRLRHINNNFILLCYKDKIYYIWGDTIIEYTEQTKQDIIYDVLYKILNLKIEKNAFINLMKLTRF